ncbi:MAG: hypothetical protein ACHREM_15105, partial [Polyangiales bacterium]
MAENTYESLFNWVKAKVHGPTGTPPMREFLVRYLPEGGAPSTVTTIPVPEQLDVATLVDDMIQQATYHAESYNKFCRFEALAFRGNDRNWFAARPFTVDGITQKVEGDPALSDSPTEAGLAGMAMRHSEANHRLTIGSIGQILAILRAENDRLRRENERLQSRADRVMEIHEDLSDRQSERDLARMKAMSAEKRRDVAASLLTEFAPFLGKAVIGAATKHFLGTSIDFSAFGAQRALPPGAPSFDPPPSHHVQPQHQQQPPPQAGAQQPPVHAAMPPEAQRELRNAYAKALFEGIEREIVPTDAQQVAVVDLFIELMEADSSSLMNVASALSEETRFLLMNLYGARQLRQKLGLPF